MAIRKDQRITMPVNIASVTWSLLMLLALPLNCHAFHQIILPSSKSPSLLRSTKSSDTDTTTTQLSSPPFSLEQFQSDSSPINNNNNNGIEIWLDLRGTSLSPTTALELWKLEQTDNNNDISSAVNAPFTKCLVSPSENINHDHLIQHNIQILIDNSNNNNEQTTIQQSNTSSSSWGQVLSLQSSNTHSTPILPDPLPAMEIVSQGKYVVLDTTGGWKKVEEEERLSYLLSLAELISSGAAVPSFGDSGSGSVDSSSRGGLGFTCMTKNEVVRVAMWIQSITNHNSYSGGNGTNVRVKTLENGLVIPDYEDGDLQQQRQFGSTRQAGLQYAIVVPYDVGLLKTAIDFC